MKLVPMHTGEVPYPPYELPPHTLYGYSFHCPGCGHAHWYKIAGKGIQWQFDGNLEKPTFAPSLLNESYVGPVKSGQKCHLFLRGGMLEFCGDSTHELAGKTVELPEHPLY